MIPELRFLVDRSMAPSGASPPPRKPDADDRSDGTALSLPPPFFLGTQEPRASTVFYRRVWIRAALRHVNRIRFHDPVTGTCHP